LDAINLAKNNNLKITGLHFYRGTGTNSTQAFTQVIDQVLGIAQQLPDWEYLDFGGGFGYPYHHQKIGFNWQEFGQILTEKLSQLKRPINLIIEPGRAAIADCAILLTKIVAVKWQENKQIVGTDTTVANLAVPSVHGGYREIVAINSNLTNALYRTDICGNTTYSRDYLGRNHWLPKLAIGDILAILDVGAYGYAMSSHFLHRPRPAEVLLEGNEHRLIRQRENYDVLLTNQLFP
ncbi:MAG: diaminopimelate decarboxylase family protein, partial [Microcystaceae cyanobacterium]